MPDDSHGFTLAQDGDPNEQRYWEHFVGRRFPNDERFWQASVIDVTRRGIERRDGRTRSDEELEAVGKTHEDVAVAQLHYTVLIHLGRSHDLRLELLDRWTFFEVLVRLTGASDCADELLERVTNPGRYHAWSEREGRDARKNWRDAHGRPLQDIHAYRNRLVHGRVVPEIIATENEERFFLYPRLDRVDAYLDWRRLLPDPTEAIKSGDLETAQVIAAGAWDRVVDYCNDAWATHLISR